MTKRLLVISTSFPQNSNGSEAAGSFVHDFVKKLSQRIDVTVLTPALYDEVVDISDTLRIHYFKVPSLPLSLLRPYNPKHWPAIIRTILAGNHAVRRAVSGCAFDHILALWALPSGHWARHAQGIPYSIWALGSDIWSLGKIPLINNALRKVLKTSQTNFADGFQLAEQVEKLSSRPCYFLPSTRSLKLRTDKKLATSPPYKLAFLGRWHPNKGIDLLLNSLVALDDKSWKLITEIRIAGGGPLSSTVHRIVDRLQKQGRPVHTIGYLDKDGAIDLLTWTDYLLIPSRIESIPVIFSDAMKSLCPAVVTPVGDMPRLMSKYSVGVMSDGVSSEALASALSMILMKPPAQFEEGLAAAAADFSIDNSVESLLKYIDFV